MTLTPDERKRKLGHGGLTKVARRTRRTLGHVSQVNSGDRLDAVVIRAITRDILKRNPDITPADIWDEKQLALAS